MADIKDFKLPDLGEGLEEGEIVEWQVSVGDVIELNQTVASIETAKAVVDVPSPFAGTVVELIGEEGQSIEVGAVFVRVQVESGSGDRPSPLGTTSSTGGGAATSPVAGTTPSPDALAATKKSTGLDADTEPQPLVGYGDRGAGRSRRRRGSAPDPAADVARAAAASEDNGADFLPEPVALSSTKPLAKPPVRKLAKDLGVDLALIRAGSGPEGSITRDDVRAATAAGRELADLTPEEIHAASTGGQVKFVAMHEVPSDAAGEQTRRSSVIEALVGAAEGMSAGEKVVPGFRGKAPGQVEQIRGIRKRIVEKMETSRREIPEATCARDADVTDLWDARKELTVFAHEEGLDIKITPFAIVLRAVVLALRRFPTLNASIDREAGEITYHQTINLGFAADTDRGLMVPNIKDAQTKSLLQIAVELGELAGKARDGRIGPADLMGGTFTVSNYGAFGNDTGNPVINHPEGAILGVGSMREKPWVHDGDLSVRRICNFSLAFDHRISDGGEGGRFVTYVADLCENPTKILLHS